MQRHRLPRPLKESTSRRERGTGEAVWRDGRTDGGTVRAGGGRQVTQLPDCHMTVMLTIVAPNWISFSNIVISKIGLQACRFFRPKECYLLEERACPFRHVGNLRGGGADLQTLIILAINYGRRRIIGTHSSRPWVCLAQG
jgi:hypothetical protein